MTISAQYHSGIATSVAYRDGAGVNPQNSAREILRKEIAQSLQALILNSHPTLLCASGVSTKISRTEISMNLQELLKSLEKPVKHKIFVSYHHKSDQKYYDAFSTKFHDTYESIHDASLDSEIDSDDVDYVLRRIREEYITGTSCTVVLIGAETYQRKYIDWEIKATLDKEHALLGVYLPSAPRTENRISVPGRLHDNIQSGYAVFTSWENVTASPESLEKYVAEAKSKSKSLIVNTREKKKRNG